jgi:hypothetical protein
MLNYNKIKQTCDENVNTSQSFLDAFFIPFVSEREGWHEKIARQIIPYKRVLNRMSKEWAGWLYSQLASHKLFKKNGIGLKYSSHTEILKRSESEQEYLKFQIEHPWRFSYCKIKQNPSKDFYVMQDMLTEESFLLYSPGVGAIKKDLGMEPELWCMLIGFNGECYQTYGTIQYFKGFQPFDIFFFAKKLKSELLFFNEVPDLIDINPVPFLMLWIGGEIPVTYNRDDLMVCCQSEYHVKEMELSGYASDFVIEEKQQVCKLALKGFDEFPHFCACYFVRKKNRLLLSSMTKRGYDALVLALNKHGNDFPKEPDILSTLAMIHTIKDVLNIDIVVNPYEKRFEKKVSPGNDKELAKINSFLKVFIDKVNNKLPYDIEALATAAGIDFATAKSISEDLLKKIAEKPSKR